MTTYSKLYTLTITVGSPTGNTVYEAIDKLEDDIDDIITNLNACHMTTNGDMIYRAAGSTTRLAIGGAGKVVFSDGTSPTWDLPPREQRAKFAYASDSAITITPGQYWCYDKFCKWTSDITSTQIASGSPVAKDWYYLYLDYSEITSNTAITSTKLTWSTTEPTWSSSAGYRGWYNGYDRCIFAVLGNEVGTDIVPFYHDGGDLVIYQDYIYAGQASKTDYDFNAIDVDTSWVDVHIPSPSFSTRLLCTLGSGYGAAQSNYVVGALVWRTNGQSGNTGHWCAGSYISPSGDTFRFQSVSQCAVITDSSGIIEIKHNISDTNTATVIADGYYFPAGM